MMPRFKLAMFQKKFVSHPMALPGQEGGQAIVVFFIALFSHHSFGFLHRLRNSALNPIPSVILSKKISNAPCILKTRAILMPLEVYMVNSPSRPILRPDAPSTPVECGGRTPLWNRETCLPAHRMPVRNQTKSNHQASASRHLPLCMFFAIAPPLPSRSPNSETPTRFFPIKAKTPLIVHHQGISRQTLKFLNAVVGRVTPCAPSWPTKPTTIGNHPHGKSGHSRWQAAAGTGLPALPCHPFSRDSRISRLPFPPIKEENPSNRASSRHIKANAQISKRRGRARHSVRAVRANQDATIGNHPHGKSGHSR